jgi:glycosyltransferase involved in cell wall biosynthesis
MADQPIVSVLLPVYNAEAFLSEAVESVLEQTFNDFEFIIIDDGSTDSTADILDYYQKIDGRIRVYRQKNRGIAFALNRGIEKVRGDYIARMDADDICLPTRFEKQVAFLDENPEVGILGAGFQLITEFGMPGTIVNPPQQHSLIRWSLFFYCPIAHPTVMMRKTIADQLGGYILETDTKGDRYTIEDYDLWVRASRVTKLYNLQEVLLYLRKHNSNLSDMNIDRHIRNAAFLSQELISNVLGEDVPIRTVEQFQRKEFHTSSELFESARLIYKLFNAYIVEEKLTASEQRLLRHDAARRLINTVSSKLRDVRMWQILLLAFKLSPVVVVRSISIKLLRMLRGSSHY